MRSTTAPIKAPTMETPYAYIRQRNNDRSAIKIYVNACIVRNKSSFLALSIAERWDFIRRERKAKLKEREECNRGNAEKMFPRDFDERGEMEWLRKVFAVYLELKGGAKGGEERPAKMKVDYADSSDDEHDDDDDELREPMSFKAEGRHEDGDGDGDVDVDMEDRGQDFDVDCQPVQAFGKELRRTWRSINGFTSIYPPSDNPEEAELEDEVSKAAVRRVVRLDLLDRESECP